MYLAPSKFVSVWADPACTNRVSFATSVPDHLRPTVSGEVDEGQVSVARALDRLRQVTTLTRVLVDPVLQPVKFIPPGRSRVGSVRFIGSLSA